MHWLRRAALAVGLLVVLLFPRLAFAQKVLLLRPPSADPVVSEAFNRLRAELALQDFEVELLELDRAEASPDELAEAARVAHAFAAISLSRAVGTASANVCIADRVTGKTSQRRLALEDTPDAPNILAVRAADLLRASLRELADQPSPPPDVPDVDRSAVPKEVRQFAAPERARFRLQAAGVGFGGFTRVGVAYGASLALNYELPHELMLGVLVAGPLLGASLVTARGTGELRQELALFRAALPLLELGRFSGWAAIAAGAYHLRAHGVAVSPPWRGKSDDVWSAALGPELAAELRFGERAVIATNLQALTLVPRPAVATVAPERYVLPWPALLLQLGFGVEF